MDCVAAEALRRALFLLGSAPAAALMAVFERLGAGPKAEADADVDAADDAASPLMSRHDLSAAACRTRFLVAADLASRGSVVMRNVRPGASVTAFVLSEAGPVPVPVPSRASGRGSWLLAGMDEDACWGGGIDEGRGETEIKRKLPCCCYCCCC